MESRRFQHPWRDVKSGDYTNAIDGDYCNTIEIDFRVHYELIQSDTKNGDGIWSSLKQGSEARN